MEPSIINESGQCRAVADVLARIGDKWTVYVVDLLAIRTMRFNEIRHQVAAISQRMLSLTLRGLERDGLVKRTVYPSIPPRVEYELTETGRTLIVPLRTVGAWAVQHRESIETSRNAYDLANPDSKTAQHLAKRRNNELAGVMVQPFQRLPGPSFKQPA